MIDSVCVAQIRNNIHLQITIKLYIKFNRLVRTEVFDSCQIDVPQQLRSDTDISILKWCQSLTFLMMTEEIGKPDFLGNADERKYIDLVRVKW